MLQLFPWLLFIHLLAIVAGIGPTYALSRIAAVGRAERAGPLALRISHALSHGLILPLAGVVLVSGFALVWVLQLNVFALPWLLVSIVLQVSVYGYSLVVQSRDVTRILAIVSSGVPPDPAAQAELAVRRARVARAGTAMKVATTVILFLMVVKPS